MKIIFALLVTILLTSCTGNEMKPIDFKDQKPRLIIEEYLSGNVGKKSPYKKAPPTEEKTLEQKIEEKEK